MMDLENDLLRIELIESKKVLEQIIGADVNHFSFPYGSHNKNLIKEAKTIYKFNAISRPNFLKEKNIIGRISINAFNCNNHKNILMLLTKKIALKYIIRLYLSFLLKKFLPNKIYIFLKTIFTKKNSKDVFNGK